MAADLRRPQPTADGYTAQLLEQRLLATFTPTGLSLRPTGAADWQWTIAAVGLGRAEGLVPLPAAPPEATDAQVRYWHEAVEEWYRLAPAGIEQGFTVAAPPAGSGPLRLALRVTTALVGEAASDGVAGDVFGWSVALSSDGNTALVGALGADIGSNADQGAAYVFVRRARRPRRLPSRRVRRGRTWAWR